MKIVYFISFVFLCQNSYAGHCSFPGTAGTSENVSRHKALAQCLNETGKKKFTSYLAVATHSQIYCAEIPSDKALLKFTDLKIENEDGKIVDISKTLPQEAFSIYENGKAGGIQFSKTPSCSGEVAQEGKLDVVCGSRLDSRCKDFNNSSVGNEGKTSSASKINYLHIGKQAILDCDRASQSFADGGRSVSKNKSKTPTPKTFEDPEHSSPSSISGKSKKAKQ